jgi:hypothetical protein
MNKSRLFAIAFIICSLQLNAAAQKALSIRSKTGTVNSYSISAIKNLTFSAGSMTVNKKDLTTNSFLISQIRNMFFSTEGSNATEIVKYNSFSKLILFPNPVIDLLSINFTTQSSEHIKIQLIDFQGRFFNETAYTSAIGYNSVKINVSDFQRGLYFVRLQYKTTVETSKFIKN